MYHQALVCRPRSNSCLSSSSHPRYRSHRSSSTANPASLSCRRQALVSPFCLQPALLSYHGRCCGSGGSGGSGGGGEPIPQRSRWKLRAEHQLRPQALPQVHPQCGRTPRRSSSHREPAVLQRCPCRAQPWPPPERGVVGAAAAAAGHDVQVDGRGSCGGGGG